jgi:hypothetical protein
MSVVSIQHLLGRGHIVDVGTLYLLEFVVSATPLMQLFGVKGYRLMVKQPGAKITDRTTGGWY